MLNVLSIYEEFLQAAFFSISDKDSKLKEKISPITKKKVNEGSLWDLDLFINKFNELRKTVIAFSTINNPSKMCIMQREEEKVILIIFRKEIVLSLI